ncbi:MAG: ATP-binding cassette domain-containing protein [Christensenellaceae bacterium]
MDKSLAIKCTDIVKQYPLYEGEMQRLKALLMPNFKPYHFKALDHISAEFKKGEVVGIVGLNGSGKSTLSSVISGVTMPTSGKVETDGSINMLSASVGLQMHLTGLQNIDYKCMLMGIDKNYVKQIRQEIVEFADIGIYINQPLRTYSTGMQSRLGFAISVYIDPDILIIDEALAVGDNSFTNKCLAKIDEFKKKQKTIIYISHAVGSMQDFCDRVMWIHMGKIVGFAKPPEILPAYCQFAMEFEAMTNDERNSTFPDLYEYQQKCL